MAKYIFGTRVHDMGKGTPMEMFTKIGGYGFDCVQLAYKKGIAGVGSYDDVTPELVADTCRAIQASGVTVAVHGTYVELSMVDEAERRKQVDSFISQIPYTATLKALCQGSETTNMSKQPGVTRQEALRALLRSLEEIMPHAEKHGVIVGIEPVFYHAMNDPETTKMVLDAIASPNLKVIFDAVNLIGPADVDCQEAMWDRAMAAWGDQIVAVHVKGMTFDQQGNHHSAPYEESWLDYPLMAGYVRRLGKDLPIMREEVKPEHAKQDIAFLKSLFY